MSVLTRPPIVTSGLVLHLDVANKKSYPGSGTTWFDMSGNGNNLTLSGNYSYTAPNNYIYFISGSNTNISYTGNINLTSTNKISIDFYCRIPTYPTNSVANIMFELTANFGVSTLGVVGSYGDNSNSDISGSSVIVAGLRGDVFYNISNFDKSLVNDSRWHHWCFIYDKSLTNPETFLYIDGILRSPSGSSSFTGNNTNNFGNVPLYLAGRSGNLYPSDFHMSSFRLYNRALSAQEVLQNYNAQKARFGL